MALTSVLFYASFAYDLVRTDYTKLFTLYIALFFLFYKLIQVNKDNFKFLVVLAIIFRVVFLFAIPNLSQDFYRFIWDGRMIIQGFNPYLYTPESFININIFPIAQAQELYNGMGELNGSHFTNYPPIKQLVFMIAALLSGKSIIGSAIVFRIFILAADIGTLYFGKKLLERLNLPTHNIFWYLLNPLIIIELSGNLHFEGIMIFFLVWSLYLFHSGKWKWAAIVFALSISVKLIPLLFLPLFFKYFIQHRFTKSDVATSKTLRNGIINLIGFYAIVVITTLLLFTPFFSSEFINNYTKTVALWFSDFEFNASIYYIARSIGYAITGYNEIAIIGKFIPLITIISVLGFTFLRKNNGVQQLIISMLFVTTLYYFTSTTIHPWYITTLVFLSVFTNYKFPIVWSIMLIISYFAYANNYNENLWLIAIEYAVVFSVFIYEVFIVPREQKTV
ncbi:glycosyltransferase 87 family protein [Aquaticitalea lipolytica]|uniref:glycosyltransferase 87 family protein n=1 Tax=Aquaticitalea lipolytica TaxID=1247562 RepID=UPI0024BAAD55|nr:glycosyltransferase 87 family protein [Aquaticitalea lipolytica]